ncbi:hypothetical protein BT96DRAFT_1001577 [Gymnopus androsaceus JB14]|uniref:Myb/SANT-like domain-containing protein n=1 Tax=Gymnopus androsaceus JB14 TaxID=1447944 RepID=A0A6A4GZ05_9AGAR|nr:hypothetical protein BT96DRAFT_1001577 [Gymnopus androsaceus JB14]
MTRNTAQAAESADSTVHNDKENDSPHPPAPSPKKLPSKPKKPAKSKAKAKDSTQSKPPPKRVIFSAENDNVMVETLLEQKEEGFATDNGGWKDAAFTAVVKALKGRVLQVQFNELQINCELHWIALENALLKVALMHSLNQCQFMVHSIFENYLNCLASV